MAINWYFSEYIVEAEVGGFVSRTFPTDEFNSQIEGDGGRVRVTELPFNNMLIGVKASPATLDLIAADARFTRIPPRLLDANLAALSAGQRSALKAKLNSLGYSNPQIAEGLGRIDLSTVTLRQVFKFAASRWHKPTARSTWADPGIPEFNVESHKIGGVDFYRGGREIDAKALELED